MDYGKRWEIISEIGAGGQGKVSRVLDKRKVNLEPKSITRAFTDAVRNREQGFNGIRKAVLAITQAENPVNHGALKELHSPSDARNSEDAEERLRRELKVMQSIKHPNLLDVIDMDTDEKWFVSQFYQHGTLGKQSGRFTGRLLEALHAFRPLVEGVAKLHSAEQVHRDIKPDNVFLADNYQLILGDFGLIYSNDFVGSRLSSTLENVGSTDWMPGWAMRMRLDDVRPSFDVFSLGKTLWSMVSDTPILRLWYYDREEFNLEKKFPAMREMRLVNDLFSKCIVEEEKDCIPDANALLEEINGLIGSIELGSDLKSGLYRPCRVCGVGNYEPVRIDHNKNLEYYGLHNVTSIVLHECDQCGHIQMFARK